ncbi:MAG: 4,5-DOPA dioxygenase extradiol [Actinobacteria bacterium]|nr:4,5-DOPA dioxygenase extradiol [Actinomycetota bacterium]
MKRMPVVFIGHGSPMNAIEENEFSAQWEAFGPMLPRPQAILSVSAHWFTPGTKVMSSPAPKMIYDMYGFPDELYQVVYQASGSPNLASITKDLIGGNTVLDDTWGYDHGTWSVLRRMYSEADIPVFQLSVDMNTSTEEHYQIGVKLRALREQGVLILGSGNIVHNLARVNWGMEGGYPWAEEFDAYIKSNILDRNHGNIIDFEQAGPSSSLAFTSLDHFAPLLYVLGASDENDQVSIFSDTCVLGSISMTSYLFD